jgi:hypothetical protein
MFKLPLFLLSKIKEPTVIQYMLSVIILVIILILTYVF